MRYLGVVLVVLLLLNGCSTKKTKPTPKQKTSTKVVTKKKTPSYKPKKQNWITTALYSEYKKWYKTPYKYGGLSKNGIDCSAFVQLSFKNAFNISIPRMAKDQAKKGYRVSKKEVKEGDLVFFKTGYNTRHSGIIIEKDKFMHVSTKRGVSISSLNNPYWKSKYWQSRRILP